MFDKRGNLILSTHQIPARKVIQTTLLCMTNMPQLQNKVLLQFVGARIDLMRHTQD